MQWICCQAKVYDADAKMTMGEQPELGWVPAQGSLLRFWVRCTVRAEARAPFLVSASETTAARRLKVLTHQLSKATIALRICELEARERIGEPS